MTTNNRRALSYEESFNLLHKVLNNRLNKTSVEDFKTAIEGFKELGFNISTAFIKGLIEGRTQHKSEVLYKIMKRSELNTHPAFRYYKEFATNGTYHKKELLHFITI